MLQLAIVGDIFPRVPFRGLWDRHRGREGNAKGKEKGKGCGKAGVESRSRVLALLVGKRHRAFRQLRGGCG